MCKFPNIKYINSYVPLPDGNKANLPPSPRAMFTLLVNKGIIDPDFLVGINNMTGLEEEIYNLIDNYPGNGMSLERIFHLIQIWGGRTGRGIYINQMFKWDEVVRVYEPFINKTLYKPSTTFSGHTCR